MCYFAHPTDGLISSVYLLTGAVMTPWAQLPRFLHESLLSLICLYARNWVAEPYNNFPFTFWGPTILFPLDVAPFFILARNAHISQLSPFFLRVTVFCFGLYQLSRRSIVWSSISFFIFINTQLINYSYSKSTMWSDTIYTLLNDYHNQINERSIATLSYYLNVYHCGFYCISLGINDIGNYFGLISYLYIFFWEHMCQMYVQVICPLLDYFWKFILFFV